VRLETFTAGTLVIAPLGTGELEVAGSGSSPGLLNAIDRGLALKVVADKGYAISGFDFSWVTVRKDLFDGGQIRDVKDLKGKKIAVTALQGGAEAIIHFLLKKAGLSLKDVDLV